MEAVTGVKPAAETALANRQPSFASNATGGPRSVTPAGRAEGSGAGSSGPRNRQPEIKQPEFKQEALRRLLARLDKRLPQNVALDIEYDEIAKRTVVRGVSKLTGETVIEYPTDEMLNLIRSIRLTLGTTVDGRA